MTTDAIALKRIDHVRIFVGNARQSAYFYRNAFGFDVVAYAGLETGVRHEAGYVLRQGEITFVLASPLAGRPPRRPAAGPARRRRAVDRPRGRRRARGVRGRRGPRGASRRRRRARSRTSSASTNSPRSAPTATRRTLRQPIAVHGVFAPGLQAARPRSLQPATRSTPSASRRSTTSSPTSRKGRWTSGSTSTARSWASRCSPASTTRTSAPSTRR